MPTLATGAPVSPGALATAAPVTGGVVPLTALVDIDSYKVGPLAITHQGQFRNRRGTRGQKRKDDQAIAAE
jgi:hypothetical protein